VKRKNSIPHDCNWFCRDELMLCTFPEKEEKEDNFQTQNSKRKNQSQTTTATTTTKTTTTTTSSATTTTTTWIVASNLIHSLAKELDASLLEQKRLLGAEAIYFARNSKR